MSDNCKHEHIVREDDGTYICIECSTTGDIKDFPNIITLQFTEVETKEQVEQLEAYFPERDIEDMCESCSQYGSLT